MLRALLLALLTSILMVSVVSTTSAASSQSELEAACKTVKNKPSYCSTLKTPDNPISGTAGVINKVTNMIAFAAGSVAVIMIIYGGFSYIISNGDPAKITKARLIITYALVGLVIIVIAREIVIFVIKKLL